MCAHFCYKTVHCGISFYCIVGFIRLGYFLHVGFNQSHMPLFHHGGLDKLPLMFWHGLINVYVSLSLILMYLYITSVALGQLNAACIIQWRHNERDGVSNHQPCDYLLKRLLRRRSKKTSKLRVTGLCEGNSLVTGEFPAQRASNAENFSTWWRHHDPLRTRWPRNSICVKAATEHLSAVGELVFATLPLTPIAPCYKGTT